MKYNIKSKQYKCAYVPEEDINLGALLSSYSPLTSYLRNYAAGELGKCHDTAVEACTARRVPAVVRQDLRQRAPIDGRIRVCFSHKDSDMLIGFTEGFCDVARSKGAPIPQDWFSACPYLGSMTVAGIPFDKLNSIIKNIPYQFEYRCQVLMDTKQSSALILFMGRNEDFMALFMSGHGDAGKAATEERIAKYEAERKASMNVLDPNSSVSLDETVQKAFASAATAIQNRINELVRLKPVEEEAEAGEQDETQAASDDANAGVPQDFDRQFATGKTDDGFDPDEYAETAPPESAGSKRQRKSATTVKSDQ